MVATATATSQFFLYLDDGPLGNLTYDGDGVSGVLLLGAQMEARAGVNLDGPSSLVPTDATTVVRDADVAVVSVERSEQDRRTQAFARLTEQGGQSRQYFIDLAAALGEPGCTITEFRPMHCNSDCNDALWSEADIFTWRMNIPHSNAGARPMNCNDDCNDPLDLGGESPFACPIRERSPAHTTVLFAYSA
jgi:hypothetical protein